MTNTQIFNIKIYYLWDSPDQRKLLSSQEFVLRDLHDCIEFLMFEEDLG